MQAWNACQVFHDIQKTSFLILVAGSLLGAMDWTGATAAVITASKICVITGGAWWKKKKYSHQKDIDNNPVGYIICVKSISVGCVSLRKKGVLIAWCVHFVIIDFYDNICVIH